MTGPRLRPLGNPALAGGPRLLRLGLVWRLFALGVLFAIGNFAAPLIAVLGTSPGYPPWATDRGSLIAHLTSALSAELGDPERLRATVSRLAELTGLELRVYAADGAQLAGAAAPAPGAEAPRGPLAMARLRGPLVSEGGGAPAYFVLDGHRPSRTSFHLLPTLAVLFVIFVTISFLVARRIAAPLDRLAATADALGRGDLSARTGLDRGDEIGTLARALDDMADRFEVLVRSERELIAAISHELRTPVGRLRVALEICEEQRDDPAAVDQALRGIGRDLGELESILRDVFTVARFERDHCGAALAVRFEACDPGAVVEAAIRRLGAIAGGHAVRAEIAPGLPRIQADPVLLRRTFDNLLDNAQRHSPSELPIEVGCCVEGDTVVVQVRDHGEGVGSADLPKLFDPFFRTDRSRARSSGGVGLGLTLCRRIVEAHGGSVEADVPAGGGLRVRVVLPVGVERGSVPG